MAALMEQPQVRAEAGVFVARHLPGNGACLGPAAEGLSAEGRALLLAVVSSVGGGDATPWVLSLLEDEEPSVRAAAVRALGRVGGPDDAKRLHPLLDEDDEDVRSACVQALTRLAHGALSPQDIAPATPEGRIAVLSAVAGSRMDALGESMRSLAEESAQAPDPQARVAGIRALSRDGGEEAWLLAATDDPDAAVRSAAVDGLARSDSSEARRAVRAALSDGAVSVRLASVRALAGRRGDEEAVASMRLALGDPDERVLLAALEALAALGDAPSAPRLAALTRHDDPDVRAAAVRALIASDPAAAGERARELFAADAAWQVRVACVEALCHAGDPEHLVAASRDADRLVRRAAIACLGRSGTAEAVARLVEETGEPSIGGDAEDALLQLACDRTALVAERLEHADAARRSALARVLAAVGAPAREALHALLRSADAGERWYAYLGCAGDAGSADAVAAALSREDDALDRALAEAVLSTDAEDARA
jgi:HEAT repeat protein